MKNLMRALALAVLAMLAAGIGCGDSKDHGSDGGSDGDGDSDSDGDSDADGDGDGICGAAKAWADVGLMPEDLTLLEWEDFEVVDSGERFTWDGSCDCARPPITE